METSTGREKHVVVFIDVVDRPEVEPSAVVAINRVDGLMEYFPTHGKIVGHLSLDQQTREPKILVTCAALVFGLWCYHPNASARIPFSRSAGGAPGFFTQTR